MKKYGVDISDGARERHELSRPLNVGIPDGAERPAPRKRRMRFEVARWCVNEVRSSGEMWVGNGLGG